MRKILSPKTCDAGTVLLLGATCRKHLRIATSRCAFVLIMQQRGLVQLKLGALDQTIRRLQRSFAQNSNDADSLYGCGIGPLRYVAEVVSADTTPNGQSGGSSATAMGKVHPGEGKPGSIAFGEHALAPTR